MDITKLGLAKTDSSQLQFAIVGELENGKRAYVEGGFYTERSAIINIGAALAQGRLYIFDNEYPAKEGAEPAAYSIMSDNGQVFHRRMYWTNEDCELVEWFTAKNVLIG